MKKLFIIICISMTFFKSKGQLPVHDKYTESIRESIYKGPRDFKPEWYLWLFHYDYLHGKDRQNLYPLFKINTALHLNVDHAEKERGYRADYADERIHDGIDRVANIQGQLFYEARTEAAFLDALYYKETIFDDIKSKYIEVENHLKPIANRASSKFGQMIRVHIDYYGAIDECYLNESKKKEMYIYVIREFRKIKTITMQFKRKLARLRRIKEVQFEKNGSL